MLPLDELDDMDAFELDDLIVIIFVSATTLNSCVPSSAELPSSSLLHKVGSH